MPGAKLSIALTAVDWSENISAFVTDEDLLNRLAATGMTFAVWARQLESSDQGNPALCFIRELQMAAQHTALLIGAGLYKPAAASIRTVVESALYYSYFRTHATELATLARNSGFYIDKKYVIEFHKIHTQKFLDTQKKIGLLSRLDEWYSKISAVLHGQIPGAWTSYTSIKQIKYSKESAEIAISTFEEAEKIVRLLFLSTVAQDFWNSFTTTSKKRLLSGLSGDQKIALNLDLA